MRLKTRPSITADHGLGMTLYLKLEFTKFSSKIIFNFIHYQQW